MSTEHILKKERGDGASRIPFGSEATAADRSPILSSQATHFDNIEEPWQVSLYQVLARISLWIRPGLQHSGVSMYTLEVAK